MDAVRTPLLCVPCRLPAMLRQLRPLVVGDLVRLGEEADGGYVVPRSAVVAADALLSLGLGYNWSFEIAVARLNPHLTIHVYDHSINEQAFMEKLVRSWRSTSSVHTLLPEMQALLELYESYRGFFRGPVVHYRERVFDHPVNTDDSTPEKILSRLDAARSLILKIDIEGAEYRVIDDLLTYYDRIHLMIVEFHHTEFLRKKFMRALEYIGEHYEVVHLHGNNFAESARDGLPDVLEATFLRKDHCQVGPRRNVLPLPGLDFPNDPTRLDYRLAFEECAE